MAAVPRAGVAAPRVIENCTTHTTDDRTAPGMGAVPGVGVAVVPRVVANGVTALRGRRTD